MHLTVDFLAFSSLLMLEKMDELTGSGFHHFSSYFWDKICSWNNFKSPPHPKVLWSLENFAMKFSDIFSDIILLAIDLFV